MRLRIAVVIALAAVSTGCSIGSFSPSRTAVQVAAASRPLPVPAAKAKHFVYWTLYASTKYPEIQFAKVPMKEKSKAVGIDGDAQNDLNYTSGMTFDKSGRLWILSFGTYKGNPVTVLVFDLPLKASSLPKYSFVLSGTDGSDALAFDPSGHLWASSPGNNEVLEYTGPFTTSGTLKAALTLSGGSYQPYGIAFDKSSNIYISVFNSSGTNSIAVDAPPYKTGPFFLDGLSQPGSLAFDKYGNLYSSTNSSSSRAVVRYNVGDQKSGDKPSIIDSAGLPSDSYMSAFAFTSTGDLYVANCGNSGSAGIDVYPTSHKAFSASLKPTVLYTNADIQGAGCAWGIAVH